jgi:hypothetical protein
MLFKGLTAEVLKELKEGDTIESTSPFMKNISTEPAVAMFIGTEQVGGVLRYLFAVTWMGIFVFYLTAIVSGAGKVFLFTDSDGKKEEIKE